MTHNAVMGSPKLSNIPRMDNKLFGRLWSHQWIYFWRRHPHRHLGNPQLDDPAWFYTQYIHRMIYVRTTIEMTSPNTCFKFTQQRTPLSRTVISWTLSKSVSQASLVASIILTSHEATSRCENIVAIWMPMDFVTVELL